MHPLQEQAVLLSFSQCKMDVFIGRRLPTQNNGSATPEALCTHFIKKYTLGQSFLRRLQRQQYRYLDKAAQSLWQEHRSSFEERLQTAQYTNHKLTPFGAKSNRKSQYCSGVYTVGITLCWHQQEGTRTPDSRDTLCCEMPLSPLDYHSQNSIYIRQRPEAFMASPSKGTCLKKQSVKKTLDTLHWYTAHNCPPSTNEKVKGQLAAMIKQKPWTTLYMQAQDWIHSEQDWEMHCSSQGVSFARLTKSANAKTGDKNSRRHFTPLSAASQRAFERSWNAHKAGSNAHGRVHLLSKQPSKTLFSND